MTPPKIYTPRIKQKGFCPNPIAQFGIPDYADSKAFPRVEGTVGHSDFWEEQIQRCVEGYVTGGVYIPGRYYYYLNFCYLQTVKRGYHHPDYVDLDLEFFELVDYVKANNKGIICIKPRRKGLSEKVTNAIIDYGMRFKPAGYNAGLCAGKDEYIETFLQRIKKANAYRPRELQLHYNVTNTEQYRAGYSIQNSDMAWILDGSQNNLWARTMDTKPNVFKGELLEDCVFEEAGEFPILQKGFGATKACFAVGERMVGTPYIFGTGGNINSSMQEFSSMFEDADTNGLERFEFYADRLLVGFFVGSTNEDGKIAEDIPHLKQMFKDQNYSPEQILGCEDTQRATESVLARKAIMAKSVDREKYYAFLTDNPLNKKELFLRFTANNFDTECLSSQRLRIEESSVPGYFKYKVAWEKNEDGTIILPHKVKLTPCGQDDPEDGDYTIMIHSFPVEGQKNGDVAGVDSYDQDISRTSKSLGSMVVTRRRGHTMKDKDGNSLSHKRIPVCLVRMRPNRKEIFYETCEMVSVLYNLLHNTLVDAGKPLIIQHYKDAGLQRFLAPRPLSFESEQSDQRHDYGMLLTGSVKSKPQMIGLLQTWVIDEADECWYPQIIEGCMNYDVLQKDSDWDEVDALGLSLVRDVDMKKRPSKHTDENVNKPYKMMTWKESSDGSLRSIGGSDEELNSIQDPFMRMIHGG